MKPGDTIIGYCHIGQQATGMLFAARTLGYKVLLYDGSFTRVAEARSAGREPVGEEGPVKYSDPYLAGLGLGHRAARRVRADGHGLGASGAFAAGAAGTVSAVAPDIASGNAYFGRYLADAGGPWRDWLLFEVAGVFVGGFLSAAMAGRLRPGRRPRRRASRVGTRLARAATGGALMGAGAVLARGCTSGLALTGGALLSVGSWAFMMSAFARRLRRRADRAAVMAMSDHAVAVGDRHRVRVRARARRAGQRAKAGRRSSCSATSPWSR